MARTRTAAAFCRDLLRESIVLGAMLLSFLTGRPGSADDQASSVFQEAEIKAMRSEYEDWLNRIREIPASSLTQWEARKAELRKKALDGFGLDPLPANVPLDLTYGDKHQRDDCTIWRVAYQSFSGLYVTAYLTVPQRAQFPAPGILRLMGHEPAWEKGIQSNSAPLARRGYVVLSVKTEHVEALDLGLPIRGVQLWNNLRGLDALCSLPQVDKTRIGVYGSSGGGMQTMDLAAMDDRVKVAVPISYPTACLRLMPHCGCNHGPLRMLQFMDNHEFLALLAPRPLGVMCVTGDWTRDTLDAELAMVSKVYDLYRDVDQGPTLSAVTKDAYRLFTNTNGRFLAERFDGGHTQPPGMYLRTFWWFDWWLQGQRNADCPTQNAEIGAYGGGVDDDRSFDTAIMTCALPQGARRWDPEELRQALASTRFHRPADINSQADLQNWQAATRARFSTILGEDESLHGVRRQAAVVGVQTVGPWRMERLWFDSEPKIRIPAILLRPANVPHDKPLPATVLLLENGKHAALVGEGRSFCAAELAAGRQVLAIDQRMQGEWIDPALDYEKRWGRQTLLWGRPFAAMAACDARSAADYLAHRRDVDARSLKIAAFGNAAAIPALLAAALDPRLDEVVCDLRFNDLVNGRKPTPLPGLEFAGNVDDLAALVAPRRLTLLNVNPVTSLELAAKAYRLSRAAAEFRCQSASVSFINSGSKADAAGWDMVQGQGPIQWAASSLRPGQTALMLAPQQVAVSRRFAVQPYHEYFVHVLGQSPRPTVEVRIRRGDNDQRLGTFDGLKDRRREGIFGFVAQPSETTCRAVLANHAALGEEAGRYDALWIEEGATIDPGPLDEKELLTITAPAGLPVGPLELKREPKPGQYCISYGPTTGAQVVEENGVKALKIPGSQPYVALSLPMTGPLRQACCYRFSLTLRTRGSIHFCFWNIPLPRRSVTNLTGDWQNVTWDFFVDGPTCEGLPPTVQFGHDLEIRSASLKQIPPPSEILY